MWIFHATLFCAAAAQVVMANPPCDNRLCDCVGDSAICSALPHQDLTSYGIDSDITKLTVKAPARSLCDTVRQKFPYARAFECEVTAGKKRGGGGGGSHSGPPMALQSTPSLNDYAEKLTKMPSMLSGELSTLGATAILTTEIPTTHTTITDTTTTNFVTSAVTLPVTDIQTKLTTQITPRRMVYKSKSGKLKYCIVTSYKCDCGACAKNCPCSTPPPCATTEKCTPRIIWITPSPPNVTTTDNPPTTPPLTTPHLTTLLLTKPPSTTSSPRHLCSTPPPVPCTPQPPTTPTSPLAPKCEFNEAVRMVMGDIDYFGRLCDYHGANWKKTTKIETAPVTTVSPPDLTTGDALTSTVSHTTDGPKSAHSAPTDGIYVAPVVRRHSAKSIQSAFTDEELNEKIDRILTTVERMEEKIDRIEKKIARLDEKADHIEMYLEDWTYKTYDSAFQAGTNFLLFFAVYMLQCAMVGSLTPPMPTISGTARIPMNEIVFERPPGPSPHQPQMQAVAAMLEDMVTDQRDMRSRMVDMQENLINLSGGSVVNASGVGGGAHPAMHNRGGAEMDRTMQSTVAGNSRVYLPRSASSSTPRRQFGTHYYNVPPGESDGRCEFAQLSIFFE